MNQLASRKDLDTKDKKNEFWEGKRYAELSFFQFFFQIRLSVSTTIRCFFPTLTPDSQTGVNFFIPTPNPNSSSQIFMFFFRL